MLVLRELFTHILNANLTIKPSKCVIGYNSLEFVGFIIGDGLQPVLDKVKCINECPVPKTKKQVRSFLGMIGFYSKFIPNCAAISAPLSDLTKKGLPNKVKWEPVHQTAFDTLKSILSCKPILRLPDINLPFILQTDASDVGLGAVLVQEESGIRQPVAFASRKLNVAERNYSVIEKECLAIVWAIDKFHRYLYGIEFFLETDHKPLTYLNKSKTLNSRLMRWALRLQPYRFNLVAIKGKSNVIADYLSRVAK